jgi:predicted NBD/HSP70 family sugar kinase
VEPARPSLELLRSLTDEHVLRALMDRRRLTRAELAAQTGLSKPTVSESVRRLTESGLVADTGQRTPGGRGRGRVGSYFALARDAGTALAVSIAPEGVVAERVDAYGDTVSRAEEKLSRPAPAEDAAAALRTAAGQVCHGNGPIPRLAVASAADPVDRATGRLVHLPDAPFLLGELDAAEVLAPYVDGPVIVDNDVNWAARAERETLGAAAPDNFAYIFLGEGLGAAITSDGSVTRGHHGLAGEIAHLLTAGPHGRATPLIEVFGALGLRQPGSTAIDVRRLLDAATGPEPRAADTCHALGQALGGTLTAITALADPELIIIGGPWGSHPAILDAITAATAALPQQISVRAAELTTEPSMAGARADALSRLRSSIITAASHERPTPRMS